MLRTTIAESPRARIVRRWFGLAKQRTLRPPRTRAPGAGAVDPGQVMLISGPSGAGKSTFLRRVRRTLPPGQVIDVARIRIGHRAPVDMFPDMPLVESLRLLSAAGLADARLWLTPGSRLSAGQKWRLRLAAALARADALRACPVYLVCDEFAAGLDEITAIIVAHALRRTIDRRRSLAAIVATAREDLTAALSPDVLVRCDFGSLNVEYRAGRPQARQERRGSPTCRPVRHRTRRRANVRSATC